jgi:hypothetical protein
MIKQITLLFRLIASIVLVSCGQSEQQTEKERQRVSETQKEEQLKHKNKNAFVDLSRKFNAVSDWDTLGGYTADLQEILIDKNRPVSFKGKIKDIVKVDSVYFVIVVDSYSLRRNEDHLARIALTSEMYKKLKAQMKSKRYSDEGCFVFTVSEILSSSTKIVSEHESEGEDVYSYLHYDIDETLLVFKGEMIDFALKEVVQSTER